MLSTRRDPSQADPPPIASGPDPTPIGTRWFRCMRRASEGAALLTPFIAILALWTSMNQLDVVRNTARTKPIGDVVAQSTQITMWMANFPDVAVYFQRDVFGAPRTAADDRRLLNELAQADPQTRRRVQSVCEVIADFFETTYTGRESFDPDDWRSWWTYMSDVYAESPVLRAFFDRRDRWYTVDDALGRRLAREDGAARMR